MEGLWPIFNQVAPVLHQEVNFGFVFFSLVSCWIWPEDRHKSFFSIWKEFIGVWIAGVKTRPVLWQCVLCLLIVFLAQSQPDGYDFSHLNLQVKLSKQNTGGIMFSAVLGSCHALETRNIPVLKTCSPTWVCTQPAAGSVVSGFVWSIKHRFWHTVFQWSTVYQLIDRSVCPSLVQRILQPTLSLTFTLW